MEKDIIFSPNNQPRALLLSSIKSALEKEGSDLEHLVGILDENTAVQQVLERLNKIQKIITLVGSRGEDDKTEAILAYINRLSDYLFVFGRKLGQDLKIEEIKWIPKH